MIDAPVLVIDSDEASAQALVDELRAQGFGAAAAMAGGLGLPGAVGRMQPAVVLYNHHFDQPADLLQCCTVKLAAPHTLVVALGSAGPAVRQLQAWNAANGYLDSIVEKPFQRDALSALLGELLDRQQAQRLLRERAALLEGLLPAGAVQVLDREGEHADEMFEAAVLFTDVRGSSELITAQPARAFFRRLNEALSAQSATVRAHRGEVVKYTGDGMMAVFRGPDRARRALHCALALAEPGAQEPLGFGIGVAQGRVLAGLVGDYAAAGQRRQYEVIGAPAHLAARLCARAEAAQVVATRAAFAAAGLDVAVEDIGQARVRGFPAPVDCVALSRMRNG